MKPKMLSISLILALATGLVVASFQSRSEEGITYVGVDACRKCHEYESIGNQYKIWASSPHGSAVRNLRTDRARTLAAKAGVKEPAEDKKCLKCHTTGGGKNKLTREEGVGCEACHGAGSGYYEMENHVDLVDRELAYAKAQRKGMKQILGVKHLKKRLLMCLKCHTEDRPCYDEDPKAALMKKITIQVADKLQNGDIILRHPLRK